MFEKSTGGHASRVCGRVSAGLLVLLGSAFVLGCGADAGTENTGNSEQALGAECADAKTYESFLGGIDGITPPSYSPAHCFKGESFDVWDYDGNLGPGGVSNWGPLETEVMWAGQPPYPSCAGDWLGSDLFVLSGTTWQYLTTKSARPLVDTSRPGLEQCNPLYLDWRFDEMPPGPTYRVTASGRDGAGVTHQVTVRTFVGQNESFDKCIGETLTDYSVCTVDTCNPLTGVITHTYHAGNYSGFICP